MVKDYTFKITTRSTRGQFVNLPPLQETWLDTDDYDYMKYAEQTEVLSMSVYNHGHLKQCLLSIMWTLHVYYNENQ